MSTTLRKVLFVCSRNRRLMDPALVALLGEKMRDHFPELG